MIRKFKWQQVLDYLNDNLDKEFDYTNPRATNDKNSCLMCSFFESQGIDLDGVNYNGDKAYKNMKDKWLEDIIDVDPTLFVAEIEDFPFDYIGDVHAGIQFGRDILEQIKQENYNARLSSGN